VKGGYLHRAMARELVATLERLGARVWTEYPAGPGRRASAVDIYAELGGLRLVCEIELGPRRVLKDVRKAEVLEANLLLIVAPTATATRAIRHRLRTSTESRVRVRVLPYGLSLKHLSQVFAVECGRDKKTSNLPPARRVRR